jgi:hypothetical protein
MTFYTLLKDGVTGYLTSKPLSQCNQQQLIQITQTDPKKHGYMIAHDTNSFLFSFPNDTRTVNIYKPY